MSGLIYSKRQLQIYQFLERVGPCPLPALEVLFGKRTERALWRLRQEQYIYNLCLNKTEFWLPHDFGHFDPYRQDVLAWFVVRLEERNGQYMGGEIALTPNNTRLTLIPGRSSMSITDEKGNHFVANLQDLKIKTLNNCLKWDNVQK